MTPTEMQALFEQAVGFHQRGKLSDAERLCRQLLAVAPRAFPALHMLAVVRSQQGHNDEAAALIERALQIRPQDVGIWMNYANILKAKGQPADALVALDRAIAIDPRKADIFYTRATTCLQLGRYGEALASCDQALALNPSHPEAHYGRGLTLTELKRFDEALAAYDKALKMRPNYAEALSNRGTLLSALGRYGESLPAFEQALMLNPRSAETHSNLGNALRELGRLEDALAACGQAVQLEPGSAIFENNLGAVLWDMNRFDEALPHFDRAVALKPDFSKAHSNLENAYRALQRNTEAAQSYRRAVAAMPDLAKGWSNLGSGLFHAGFYDEALAVCDRAIAMDAHDADAHYQRGVLLRDLRRNSEALESFERAMAENPNHRYALGMAADMAGSLCDWERTEGFASQIQAALDSDAPTPVVSPQIIISLTGDPAAALGHARRYVRDVVRNPPAPLSRGAYPRKERIRIAYVSADFTTHPVGYQIVDTIEGHDRARFEVFGISLGSDQDSDIRARLKRAFDGFEQAGAMDSNAVAALLRGMEIDIAIDLNGHARGGRLDIFAQRPAPVQASYFGYSGTSGADFIDYVIADPVLLPQSQQPFFSEKIVRLPDSFWPAQPRPDLPSPQSRQEAGLPEKALVFCAFSNPWKIGAAQFALWMRLLAAVPGSVLWLKDDELVRDRLRQQAAARGIDPARLVFATRVSGRDNHLARQRLADLFLDTLPYNAHATASDALAAGLPVLTCAGNSFAARVAASLVTAAGVPELAVSSLADYEALAIALARDPVRLAALRARLNEPGARLFDSARFRQGLEAAYMQMHDIALRGEPPRPFNVEN